MQLKVFRSEGASAQSMIETEVNDWLSRNPKLKISFFNTGVSGPHREGFMISFLYTDPKEKPASRRA